MFVQRDRICFIKGSVITIVRVRSRADCHHCSKDSEAVPSGSDTCSHRGNWDRQRSRGGRPLWPHPPTQGVTSCLLSEQSGKAAPETRGSSRGASLSLICGGFSGRNDSIPSAYLLLMYILGALAHGASPAGTVTG